jgi:unsaturated chondroitin disaccharide hydrolase
MRRIPLQLLLVGLTMPGASASTLDLARIAADLRFIESQAQKTVASLTPDYSSYPSAGGEKGTWATVSASDWTSGFFPGELWLLYQATGSAKWLADAKAWTAPLASQATRTDTHDVGFIIGTSFGNAYRLTGDPSYDAEILAAAGSLATRYNPTVGAVRSWDFGSWQYPVIIDNMMTLAPLQWGATHGGNPAWGVDASTHAQTTIADLVRGNGSTYQIANFDPTTGALLNKDTLQGLSVNSAWSRGQAWGIYGFVEAYQATGNPAFLTEAERIASYFFQHLPSDYVPYWDFNAPATSMTPRDTSAAAIAADGLLMLSTVAKTKAQRATYLTEAEDILESLSANYLAPSSGEAVLIDGSNNVPGDHEVNTALIFGDYYFTEALLRLQDALGGNPGWALYDSLDTPAPSTWVMTLLGFVGLGYVGIRRHYHRPISARPDV